MHFRCLLRQLAEISKQVYCIHRENKSKFARDYTHTCSTQSKCV